MTLIDKLTSDVLAGKFDNKTPCIRCGYCCKQGSCYMGVYDTEARQCIYLKQSDNDYSCGIKDTIENHEQNTVYPMFGSGCCSTLNEDRRIKNDNSNRRKDQYNNR